MYGNQPQHPFPQHSHLHPAPQYFLHSQPTLSQHSHLQVSPTHIIHNTHHNLSQPSIVPHLYPHVSQFSNYQYPAQTSFAPSPPAPMPTQNVSHQIHVQQNSPSAPSKVRDTSEIPPRVEITITKHSGEKFTNSNLFEKANLDYVFNILQIIQAALYSAFPSSNQEEISGYKQILSQRRVPTGNQSAYEAIKSVRNQLSHNNVDSLHSNDNVQGFLEKARIFIFQVQGSIESVNLPQCQQIIDLQKTYYQHKVKKSKKIKQYKTDEDVGRVLIFMTGICLFNCAAVRPGIKFTLKRETEAVKGIDAYYWLKWGSKGYLIRKNDNLLSNQSFADECSFLLDQRLCLYHREKKGTLDLRRMYSALLFLALYLGDQITNQNLEQHLPLVNM